MNAIPTNILNILQLALLVGSGLIAYKLLTIHAPAEDVILENIVSKFNEGNCDKGPVKGADEKVGEILGAALKKYMDDQSPHSPRQSTTGTCNVL